MQIITERGNILWVCPLDASWHRGLFDRFYYLLLGTMNVGASPPVLPAALKRQWWGVVGLFGLLVACGSVILAVATDLALASRWGFITAGALLYLLGFTRFHLRLNRTHPGEAVASQLGISNQITLTRGLLYGLLSGFLVIPVLNGLWAWVPGFLYTVASLTDLIDGRLARQRGETTGLGAKLDVEVDSFGILIAFLLGTKYGQLPAFFIIAGSLFYAYRIILWGWMRSGKTVHPLPESRWRSTIGGFEVGFLCVMLWPVFEPPLTIAAGTVVLIPVLASFLWDGLIATGQITPHSVVHQRAVRCLHWGMLTLLPALLRIGLGILVVSYLLSAYPIGITAFPKLFLAINMGIAAGMTVLGWKRRGSAASLLVASALLSLVTPLTSTLLGIIILAFIILIIELGIYK